MLTASYQCNAVEYSSWESERTLAHPAEANSKLTQAPPQTRTLDSRLGIWPTLYSLHAILSTWDPHAEAVYNDIHRTPHWLKRIIKPGETVPPVLTTYGRVAHIPASILGSSHAYGFGIQATLKGNLVHRHFTAPELAAIHGFSDWSSSLFWTQDLNLHKDLIFGIGGCITPPQVAWCALILQQAAWFLDLNACPSTFLRRPLQRMAHTLQHFHDSISPTPDFTYTPNTPTLDSNLGPHFLRGGSHTHTNRHRCLPAPPTPDPTPTTRQTTEQQVSPLTQESNINLSDTLFADLINSELVCNSQAIQSLQTAEGLQLTPIPRSTIHTAADIAEQLKIPGFRLDAHGSWQNIGLLPFERLPPDIQALDRRMEVSMLVLSISELRGWSRSHRAGVDEMRTTLAPPTRIVYILYQLPAILAFRKICKFLH